MMRLMADVIKHAGYKTAIVRVLIFRTISDTFQTKSHKIALLSELARSPHFWDIEPQQRAHSPSRIGGTAGLASEYKIRLKVLTVESRLGGTAACCRVLQCRSIL